MSGPTPAVDALFQLENYTTRPTLVAETPAPLTPQGGDPVPRNLTYNFPQPPGTTESKNLVNAINKLNRRCTWWESLGNLNGKPKINQKRSRS